METERAMTAGSSAVGALPYFVTKRTDQGDEVIQKGKIGNDGSFTIGKHFLSLDPLKPGRTDAPVKNP